jgi:regulator of protease activity HflC (stomatin/prohibitin superfamily)
MAEIRRYPVFRHLRADASSFVLHYRGTRLLRSGRGMAFWFRPLTDSVAEVPADDRELALVIHGRSADFQEVSVQGVLTYRVMDPAKLASRVDFTVDSGTGAFLRQPLEKISQALAQLAQQHAGDYLLHTPIRQILIEGQSHVRTLVEEGLASESQVTAMGLGVVSVRIHTVKPSPDLEKALEAPARERIKQEADEAAFDRRAQAVDKERAIQDNELQNKIELAKREENLITQQGTNAKRTAQEKAESDRIGLEAAARAQALKAQSEAKAHEIKMQAEANSLEVKARAEAASSRLHSDAEAEGIRATEGAHVEAERQRVDAERLRLEAYGALPNGIMLGLALKELAGKLQRIDHLNLGPELLGPALVNLLEAGTRKLGTEA